MSGTTGILDAAEEVLSVLAEHRIEAVVIGAVAMAAHHYVRQTEDLDLGVVATVQEMRTLAAALVRRGFEAELREPGPDDPLAGVIDVRGDFGLVQIISYAGRFPAVIEEALRSATLTVREGSRLRIVPIPHLVALKLYAGGYKSRSDIMELLERNPDVDREAISSLCTRYRLSGWDELVRAGLPDTP